MPPYSVVLNLYAFAYLGHKKLRENFRVHRGVGVPSGLRHDTKVINLQGYVAEARRDKFG